MRLDGRVAEQTSNAVRGFHFQVPSILETGDIHIIEEYADSKFSCS